jgi:hypothetical protein
MRKFSERPVAALVATLVVLLAPTAARAANESPVAVTGLGQSVRELALVTLDGSQSFDPDGDALTFRWTQVAGSPVTLSDASAAQPAFVAPAQPPLGQETLMFSLTVCDPSGACSAPSTTNVVVNDVYIPPNCSFATASPSVLPFDPGGTLRHVSVSGVTGSASASITVSVTSVFQDEPLTGGDDHTSPDAILRPSGGVDLRAERRSNGDGRIYHISFVASDGFGGSCTGVVMVSVPRKEGVAAVDEGALYNSLGP